MQFISFRKLISERSLHRHALIKFERGRGRYFLHIRLCLELSISLNVKLHKYMEKNAWTVDFQRSGNFFIQLLKRSGGLKMKNSPSKYWRVTSSLNEDVRWKMEGMEIWLSKIKRIGRMSSWRRWLLAINLSRYNYILRKQFIVDDAFFVPSPTYADGFLMLK